MANLQLDPRNTVLLVVDVQEKLCGAMPPAARAAVEANARILIEGAKLLGLPVFVSEQYPRGLGPTLASLTAALPAGVRPFEKATFSCAQVPSFVEALAATGRRQLVLCGMETHVCVFQTARELARGGVDVHVASDAVCSRTEANRATGLSLLERAGATLSSTEAVLFDLLGSAANPAFKAISALVK